MHRNSSHIPIGSLFFVKETIYLSREYARLSIFPLYCCLFPEESLHFEMFMIAQELKLEKNVGVKLVITSSRTAKFDNLKKFQYRL